MINGSFSFTIVIILTIVYEVKIIMWLLFSNRLRHLYCRKSGYLHQREFKIVTGQIFIYTFEWFVSFKLSYVCCTFFLQVSRIYQEREIWYSRTRKKYMIRKAMVWMLNINSERDINNGQVSMCLLKWIRNKRGELIRFS